MEKSVIKRLQSMSYSFVAFFFVVLMWTFPKFFVKELCMLLFIGSIALLVVCAILAQVYLYVRYKDNSRLSWLCTSFLIVVLISQCLVFTFPSWGEVIYAFQFLIIASSSALSILPKWYKEEEDFNQFAVFSLYWVIIAALLYIIFQQFLIVLYV